MKKINESFVCIYCGKSIPPAKSTCRNHCPFCFVSLHVDHEIPGDRLSECKSKMYPIEYLLSNWKIKILFECEKCKSTHWNKAAVDDDIWNLDRCIYEFKKITCKTV